MLENLNLSANITIYRKLYVKTGSHSLLSNTRRFAMGSSPATTLSQSTKSSDDIIAKS